MVRERFAALFARACRRGIVIAVALLAASCAPALAPRGLSNEPAHLDGRSFVTRDGLHLPLREWDAGHPKAIIVALHGMSDYSEAFDLPGPVLAAHGISVYAYDQRGFGAGPSPGLWGGDEALRQDMADCVAAVRAEHPGVPVFALGESMGGAVVLSALADRRPPRIAGAILVAPAVWSREDMPLSYRVALWLAAHIVPWLNVSGEGLHIVPSDNIPMLIKLSKDKLFQHEARADQVYGLVNLMDDARHAPEHLPDGSPPILFLYGAKDQIIPKAPAQAVIAALGSRAEVHRFPNGYHMLLRDLDREQVEAVVTAWISHLR